jgi:hypothetical protein
MITHLWFVSGDSVGDGLDLEDRAVPISCHTDQTVGLPAVVQSCGTWRAVVRLPAASESAYLSQP